MAGELTDPPAEIPSRKQPAWLVVLALGLAVVAGVLILVLINRDGEASDSPTTAGALDCGGRNFMSGNADYADIGNGAPSPALALQSFIKVIDQPSFNLAGSEWTEEGPTLEPSADTDGDPSTPTLLYVRREDGKVTGQIPVGPVGSGWIAGPVTICQPAP